MCNIVRILIWCYVIVFIISVDGETNVKRFHVSQGLNRSRSRRVRCSRRYTPGACFTMVHPVWTFIPLQQNCSERLGCEEVVRANRFNSYSGCMKNCHQLYLMVSHVISLKRGDRGKLKAETDVRVEAV